MNATKEMIMRRFKFFISLGLVLCGFTAESAAQAPPLEKLRVTYSALGGSQASVWITAN